MGLYALLQGTWFKRDERQNKAWCCLYWLQKCGQPSLLCSDRVIFYCENNLGTSFETALNITVFSLVLQQKHDGCTLDNEAYSLSATLLKEGLLWISSIYTCYWFSWLELSVNWCCQEWQRNIKRCGSDTFFHFSEQLASNSYNVRNTTFRCEQQYWESLNPTCHQKTMRSLLPFRKVWCFWDK